MVADNPMLLDPDTFLFCMSVFSYVIAAISFSSQEAMLKIGGLKEWGFAMMAAGTSFMLFFLRGFAPDFFSLFLANGVMLLAPVFAVSAYSNFYGVKFPMKHVAIVGGLGLAGISSTYFLEMPRFIIVFSVSWSVASMFIFIVTMIAKHAELKKEAASKMVVGILSLFALALYARCLQVLTADSNAAQTMVNNGTQFIFMVAGAVTGLGASVGFLLMVHERLRKLLHGEIVSAVEKVDALIPVKSIQE